MRAVFRSHIDGTLLELTPERAVAIQENLGSDIAMCLDECPPGRHVRSIICESRSVGPSTGPSAAGTLIAAPDQALFAIVQGGLHQDLRGWCAEELIRLDFPGYALGGFSVGETTDADDRRAGPGGDSASVRKSRVT